MKKILLAISLLLILTSFTSAWNTNYNIIRTNFRMVGVAACTVVVPEHRGSVMQYYWVRADSIKDSIPAIQVRWQYSADNVVWTNGGVILESLGSVITGTKTYNTWYCESLGIRQHPNLRVICTGRRATSRGKLFFRSFIIK